MDVLHHVRGGGLSGRGKCPGNMSGGNMSRAKCPDPE